MNSANKRGKQDRIVDTSAEIDPGVLTQKPQRRLCAGEQDWNDGKALATALGSHLSLQREILLPLLPRSHFSLPDADRHRSTACQGRLQCLQPRLPRRQIPPVEKDLKPLLAQPPRKCLHMRMVTPVVTQKYIAIRRHSVSLWFERWSERKEGTPQT